MEDYAMIQTLSTVRTAESVLHTHLGSKISILNSTDTIWSGPDVGSIVGVKGNMTGDLRAFLSSLVFNVLMLVGCMAFFSVMRFRVPVVYENNFLTNLSPTPPANSWFGYTTSHFGWLPASVAYCRDEVTDSVGLDAAMLLEYCNFCMRTLALTGTPLILIMSPLHLFLGRANLGADHLSWISMANLENNNVLYWVHAFFVWYVVLIILHMVKTHQKSFLESRFEWLRDVPVPRATTVMVENIPLQFAHDAALKDFFAERFPEDKLVEVSVVKKTSHLLTLVQNLESAKLSLQKAEYKLKNDVNGNVKENKDWVGECEAQITKLHEFVQAERDFIEKTARTPLKELVAQGRQTAIYSQAAFVTFDGRREAEIALNMRCTVDDEEFMMSIPPDPTDVMYTHLMLDRESRDLYNLGGIGCIVAIFFAFIPAISAVSSIANMRTLRRVPFVDNFFADEPVLEGLVQGLLASGVLTVFMSFLPTVLMLVFKAFFKLDSWQWSQHKLQVFYFWFQVIFTILATAIGSSLWDRLQDIVNSPTSIFGILADSMPSATHFYLSFIAVQWTTHALNLTRYVNLSKYLFWSCILEQEDAVQMSEPEDQDYYGMGGRSARFSINMAIAMVFCSLSPMITVVAIINFAICRVIYGHLLVHAETKKPDLGGVFWVTQMKHVFVSLMIYVMLMIGILYRRASDIKASLIVVPLLFFVIYRQHKFDTELHWESLPFQGGLKSGNKEVRRKSVRRTYIQSELLPDEQKIC
uniref:CSC1/OSCA1-like 7TM region domain-containing protein n=1 Tax=Noctiluca scintillans TaxID=2966 RepID=A0A7S0ZV34_NOCSC|mmetsp:Transcript_19764/g.52863  ORF Transcript_19764/g.52863 Transcript_19764/m.52863 type:complete len:754 (+) Transcript_19764:100-2361(+)